MCEYEQQLRKGIKIRHRTSQRCAHLAFRHSSSCSVSTLLWPRSTKSPCHKVIARTLATVQQHSIVKYIQGERNENTPSKKISYHEYIVGGRNFAPSLEQLQQVVELAVDVSADLISPRNNNIRRQYDSDGGEN